MTIIPLKSKWASTLKLIPMCNRERKLTTYYTCIHSTHSLPCSFSYLSEGIRTIKSLLQYFQFIEKRGTFLYFRVPCNPFRLFALMQIMGLAYNKQYTSHVKFRKQSMLERWASLFHVILHSKWSCNSHRSLCIFKSTQAQTQSVGARFSYTSGRQGTKQNRSFDFKQNLYKLYLNILHLPTTETSGEQMVNSLHFHLKQRQVKVIGLVCCQ